MLFPRHFVGPQRLAHCAMSSRTTFPLETARICVPTQCTFQVIMRPSSIAGGRILRRTLSVCPSVPLSLPSVTWRHLANYNDTRAEGRISYGHLGRTNLLLLLLSSSLNSHIHFPQESPSIGRNQWLGEYLYAYRGCSTGA